MQPRHGVRGLLNTRSQIHTPRIRKPVTPPTVNTQQTPMCKVLRNADPRYALPCVRDRISFSSSAPKHQQFVTVLLLLLLLLTGKHERA